MILYRPWQFITFVAIVLTVAFFSIPTSEKLGQIYFDSYQYDKALIYFNKVNTLDENNIPTLKKLKEYFLIQGSVPEALEVQKKLVFLRPKNISYLEELEQLYDWNQQPVLKIQTMKKRADLLPMNERIEIYIEMFSGLRWLRNYEEADRLAEFIQLDPILNSNVNLNELIIEYYLATKKSEEAIHLLEKNVIKNPSDTRSIERVAEAYRFEKNYEQSIVYYQRLIGISENDSSLVNSVAINIEKLKSTMIVKNFSSIELIIDGLLKMKRNDLALSVRQVLIKALPEDPYLKFILIESYLNNNMQDEAIKLLEGFEFESIKNADSIYNAASQLNDIGKPEIAVRLMEKLVEKFPRQSSYLEFLGDLYEKLGRKDKAIEIYFKILDFKKRVMLNQKSLLLALNESSLRNLPIIPKNYSFRKNPIFTQDKQVTRVRQKVLYLIDGMDSNDRKIELLEKLLNDSPNDKLVLKRLGYIYFTLGNAEEAYRFFDMAYIGSPNDKDVLEVLARRDIEQKKWVAAELKLESLKRSESYVDLQEELLFQTESPLHENFCRSLALKDDVTLSEKIVLSRCYFRERKYKQSLQIANDLIDHNSPDARFQFLALSSCLEMKNVDCAENKIQLLNTELQVSESEMRPYREYLEEIKAELHRLNAWSFRTSMDVLVYQSWTSYKENLEIVKRWDQFGLSFETNYIHFAQNKSIVVKNLKVAGKYFSDSFEISVGPHFYQGITSQMSPYLEILYSKKSSFMSMHYSRDRSARSSKELVENNVRTHQLELYAEENLSKRLSSAQSLSFFRAEANSEIGNGYNSRLDLLYKIWGNLPLWSGVVFGHSSSSEKNGSTLFTNNYFRNSSPYGLVLAKKQTSLVNKFPMLDWDTRIEVIGDYDRGMSFARILNAFARVKYHYNFNKFIELSSSWGQETTSEAKGDAWEFQLSWNHWW
ncbi:MAG: hypothetical protein CO099_12830 [Bdellovibrio sp. CG_4_9_14_3_um_filter_39_7]|nr:MAG: hypothetical protein CO099_12830 [Bdellovibrio sp. CG_4_9_14_3_um_filter_39_7]